MPDLFDPEKIITKALVITLAKKAQGYILHRVQSGQYFPDMDSDTPAMASYSTSPMPIPYGKFIKLFGKSVISKDKKIKRKGEVVAETSSAEFSVRRINGHAMVIIKGGYKRYRQLSQKEDGFVTEHWTGRMMRNLGIVSSNDTEAIIGFTSEEEKQKATWQHVGAGKNKVTHIFMKLTKKEIEQLTAVGEKIIFQKLK